MVMRSLMKSVLCSGLAALMLAGAGCSLKASKSENPKWEHVTMGTQTLESGVKKVVALDARQILSAAEFEKIADNDKEWITAARPAPFAFDELIYSWSWREKLAPGQGWRLYLRVAFEDGTQSPWLYAGFWGDVAETVQSRRNPQFEHGHIAMDQLLLKRDALSWQFKLVDEGQGAPLNKNQRPMLHIITTKNSPPPSVTISYAAPDFSRAPREVVLDLPFRLQQDSKGTYIPDKCQSAAVASAMEYYGTSANLEDIIAKTHDPEYNYPGIWPRTLGAAADFGFDVYIDRFRDWDQVRATLAENKVILCSIRMPKSDAYIAPPYDNIGGHIVALCGVTADDRVIVEDSAVTKDGKGHRLQWLAQDFEKVWMDQKGGVGMVLCPPAGHEPRHVTDLPPFPKERYRKQAAVME